MFESKIFVIILVSNYCIVFGLIVGKANPFRFLTPYFIMVLNYFNKNINIRPYMVFNWNMLIRPCPT